jgi:hypothetical protein
MSVELYPTLADLDEKLSALEDPELAARIVCANPEIFGSVAAREEVSVFAAAWKRFGTAALAATVAISIGLGFAFAPHPARQAASPKLAPAAAPVRHVQTARLAFTHRAAAAVSRPASAHLAAPVALPVVVPMHHAAAFSRPAAAHNMAAVHASAPASAPKAASTQAASAQPQAEAPIAYESNAQVVSGNTAPVDSTPPNGTKSTATNGQGDTSVAAIVMDSCTPQGGRLGMVMHSMSAH